VEVWSSGSEEIRQQTRAYPQGAKGRSLHAVLLRLLLRFCPARFAFFFRRGEACFGLAAELSEDFVLPF
jgi:hypothetical protein